MKVNLLSKNNQFPIKIQFNCGNQYLTLEAAKQLRLELDNAIQKHVALKQYEEYKDDIQT